MIEGLKAPGVSRANAHCDDCQRVETVACGYVQGRGKHNKEPDKGQVVNKLQRQGWSDTKGRLRCPTCTAKQKVVPMAAKTKVEDLRKPSMQQKREIILMLTDTYDTEAGRYKGHETDRTLADVMNVLPGWVAEIREDLFGPSGGNSEIEAVEIEIASLKAETSAAIKALQSETNAKTTSLTSRIDKIKDAVGPRARSA